MIFFLPYDTMDIYLYIHLLYLNTLCIYDVESSYVTCQIADFNNEKKNVFFHDSVFHILTYE